MPPLQEQALPEFVYRRKKKPLAASEDAASGM
jgi:hypothetical protein